jgi:hypothetical protein
MGGGDLGGFTDGVPGTGGRGVGGVVGPTPVESLIEKDSKAVQGRDSRDPSLRSG